MAKKQKALWTVFLQGIFLSLGLYLSLQFLLAFLLVKSVLPEANYFSVLVLLCGLSALIGGMYCARRSPLGTLSSSLISAAGFSLLLIAVGLLCYEGITWTGRGGVLLLSILVGGVLAGLLGSKLGRRVKRKAKRG